MDESVGRHGDSDKEILVQNEDSADNYGTGGSSSDDDIGGSAVPSPNYDIPTKVYKKRWYILAVFSFLGALQGMVWNTFGPISMSVLGVFCPDWSTAQLATLGNWGNIMYILPVVPVMWYFETKGLRASMIMTGSLMVAGTLARCPPFLMEAFTYMCHLCAILNGIAGIVIFSAPSAVSSAWFPASERTTATGIAIFSNNLGNAISFLVGPAIVPDPAVKEHSANGTGFWDKRGLMFPGPPTAVANLSETIDCPPISPNNKSLIALRVKDLMYAEFGAVALCFIAILFYFPSRPRLPPSVSSTAPRMDFKAGIIKMLRNKDALLMTVAFSLFNGLVASWYSVVNITFRDLPLDADLREQDRCIGYIGMLCIVGNCVATCVVSRFVDLVKGRMKVVLAVLMSGAVACWVWMSLICLKVIPFSLAQLYVSTILASSLTYSTSPIFFELTAELAYPVPEGLVGGFLTCFYNAVGMIFLFIFYVPEIASNPKWIPYAIMISSGSSLPILLGVKERYNRSVVDQFQEPTTSPGEIASYPAV